MPHRAPGEVVAQLNAFRRQSQGMGSARGRAQENRPTSWFSRSVALFRRIYLLPTDPVDHENPNIYLTSPTLSRFPLSFFISNLTGRRRTSAHRPFSTKSFP